MNKRADAATPATSSFDAVKWVVIALLIAAGVWANYRYSEVEWALRFAGWIVLACVVLAIAYQTNAGRQAWEFSKSARTELRKVVWPTRQETIQTTIVIVVLVVLMALILWGIDSFLLWAMGWFTGGR
jgi:preprotein translocase subunit SecE